jgi:transaldolase
MTLLESLKKYTVVVADTGDIDAILRHKPQDATTNPSLLYSAAQKPAYKHLVDQAREAAQKEGGDENAQSEALMDHLSVIFGREILKIVPGRVSTEVDAGLSFDTEDTINKAHRLIGLYEKAGVDKNRILIKIASTWQGIKAAERLEKEGIHCNLTLLFSFAQAVGCAEAGVTLISPFVGRIYDYYKKERGGDIPISEDPGVASKVEQITELAGCDLMTISPDLLEKLESSQGDLPRKLSSEEAKKSDVARVHLDEKTFYWMHNEDPMAVDKLSEGIRKFYADARKLREYAKPHVLAGVAS